jgi:serine/threonine protein kinase
MASPQSKSELGAQSHVSAGSTGHYSMFPLDAIVLSDRLMDFDGFQPVSILGRNLLRTVERYRDESTGQEVAVKSFTSSTDRWESSFIREIEVLLKLKHPCVVALVGFLPPSIFTPARLATAFVDGLSLRSVLEFPPAWWTGTIKSQTIIGLTCGMKYVHSHGIIHRDLKPSNVLLDSVTHRVHICDFGSSRFLLTESTLTQQTGTPCYMAPEMYEDVEYDFKVDVFSFGLIAYEIVAGQPFFSRNLRPEQIMKKVLSDWRPSFPEHVAMWVRELISLCWSGDPARRPSFCEILATLESNDFKIVSGVGSMKVRRFLSSVEGSN